MLCGKFLREKAMTCEVSRSLKKIEKKRKERKKSEGILLQMVGQVQQGARAAQFQPGDPEQL